LDDDVVGSQQKQSPEVGISKGGPIPLQRDITISDSGDREGSAGRRQEFKSRVQIRFTRRIQNKTKGVGEWINPG